MLITKSVKREKCILRCVNLVFTASVLVADQ